MILRMRTSSRISIPELFKQLLELARAPIFNGVDILTNEKDAAHGGVDQCLKFPDREVTNFFVRSVLVSNSIHVMQYHTHSNVIWGFKISTINTLRKYKTKVEPNKVLHATKFLISTSKEFGHKNTIPTTIVILARPFKGCRISALSQVGTS